LWFRDRKCLRLNYLEVEISIWNVELEESDGRGWEKKISFLMEKDSFFLMEKEIFFLESQQHLCWQETWSETEKNMRSELSVILSERIFEEEILISILMIVGEMVFFLEEILNEISSEEISISRISYHISLDSLISIDSKENCGTPVPNVLLFHIGSIYPAYYQRAPSFFPWPIR